MAGYLIDHQCPQCGAPAILKETDRIFICPYCKVTSFLLRKDFFRYLLPRKCPENKALIYVPYWRFKGMYYSCVSTEIKDRYIDQSYRAYNATIFPVSLGFRAQALKLRFVSPDTPGLFIKPNVSLEKALTLFQHRSRQIGLNKPVFTETFIGETISMIYAPYYIEENLYDAVLNEPVSKRVSPELMHDDIPRESPLWPIQFAPCLCPKCGWDMTSQKEALILFCRNCGAVWLPTIKGFNRLKYRRMAGSGDIFLPFWKIKASVTGIDLKTYNDLSRLANLPKIVGANRKDKPFYFWVVGFKVRPRTFLQLNRNATLFQPEIATDSDLPKTKLYPVTLPINQAADSLKIILADFIKPRGKFFPNLETIKIIPQKATLVLIPFKEGPHEYIHSECCLTVNKNQLDLAGNL